MTITITAVNSDLFTPSPVVRSQTLAELWTAWVAAEIALYIRTWHADNPPQPDPHLEWLDPQWVQRQIVDIVDAFPEPKVIPAVWHPRCWAMGHERNDWPDVLTFPCRYAEGHKGRRHSWQRVGRARQLAAVGTEHAEDGT